MDLIGLEVDKLNKTNLSELFPHNFLASVAMEVRFPPLLAMPQYVPEFQKKIRHNYPNMAKGFTFFIYPQPSFQGEASEWAFSSKDGNKEVKIGFDRFAMVVKEYESYRIFDKEMQSILNTLSKMTSIDSYSRTGLRYVNEIPIKNQTDPYSEIFQLFNPLVEISRIADDKPFKFNLDYRFRPENNCMVTTRNIFREGRKSGMVYVIDIDSFTEDTVEHGAFAETAQRLHDEALKEFHRGVKDEFLNVLRGKQ